MKKILIMILSIAFICPHTFASPSQENSVIITQKNHNQYISITYDQYEKIYQYQLCDQFTTNCQLIYSVKKSTLQLQRAYLETKRLFGEIVAGSGALLAGLAALVVGGLVGVVIAFITTAVAMAIFAPAGPPVGALTVVLSALIPGAWTARYVYRKLKPIETYEKIKRLKEIVPQKFGTAIEVPSLDAYISNLEDVIGSPAPKLFLAPDAAVFKP